jgi:outer membrane protein OmpA-like peptidoglycan-associated protein
MKILIIGFLVFLGWSSLSTYVYVCKIKGLCLEVDPVIVNKAVTVAIIPVDTSSKVLVQKQAIMPEALITLFAFDKSDFSGNADAETYFKESMTYMFVNKESILNIAGHTDAVGSEAYNQTLGYNRAQSVQQFFEGKGMPASRIKIESKGEKEPAEDNNSISGRAKNRRAVITIKP